MKSRGKSALAIALWILLFPIHSLRPGAQAKGADAPLPAPVRAVWRLDQAQRQKTRTRERICLNGLWRRQPAADFADAPPTDNWGFFKTPGFWPGNTSYIQEDSQTLFAHPNWRKVDLGELTLAWYQREMTIPVDWTGRRVALRVEYLNSLAIVFLDGKRLGELRYPGGELDLTHACHGGGSHVLSLLVAALPLKSVLTSHTDSNAARMVRGSVERRGLCGDVELVSEPVSPRITRVGFATSVRRGVVEATVGLDATALKAKSTLRVQIQDRGRTVHEMSRTFAPSEVSEGRLTVASNWRPERLWDIHTPENTLTAGVVLEDADNRVLDEAFPVRFGYREFWIDGRDFFLNGTRIFLSALPLDNAQIGARTATYEAARDARPRILTRRESSLPRG